MSAFHGYRGLKARILWGLRQHKRADAFLRGTYGTTRLEGRLPDKFRGCAVGCTAHILGLRSYRDHEGVADGLGIPVELMYAQDAIFETLPLQDAFNFPLDFVRAIPVGADLSGVWPKFLRLLIEYVSKTIDDDYNSILPLIDMPADAKRTEAARNKLREPIIDGLSYENIAIYTLGYLAGDTSAAQWVALAYAATADYGNAPATWMRNTLLSLLQEAE